MESSNLAYATNSTEICDIYGEKNDTLRRLPIGIIKCI